MNHPRRIALFGGTFDPVHLGHLHLADVARRSMQLDEVRFLPCRISPHKSGTSPTPAADRIAMLELATQDLPWAVIDDFEVHRQDPSFSWVTAEAMREKFPGARLFWIMGGDQWDALPEWAQPQRLAECVEFIVFARGKTPVAREGYILHVLEGGHPASATAIRAAIQAGETQHPWLPSAVARWIADHRLYQDDGSRP